MSEPPGSPTELLQRPIDMKSILPIGASLALVPLAAGMPQQPEFDSGQFRLDLSAHMPPGQAVLELKSKRDRGTRVRLEVDTGVHAVFRDDGREMDVRANDGVFTGVVPADLNRERQIFTRLVTELQRGVPIPIFEGRELTRKINSKKLIPKPHSGVLPLVGTSARSTVDPEKSLFITDPVVFANEEHSFNPCTGEGDPNGAWAFGHIMTELAGDHDPSDFALDWLSHWGSTQTVNGFSVSGRNTTLNTILDAWDPDGDGILAMEDAPFHPVTVSLRVDLRRTGGYGSGNAGEARIVYSFVDESCSAADPLLVICEYAINKSSCGTKAWGEDWAALSDMAIGSDEYADALADLTRQFTDLTTSPNFNRLGQIRTNERIQFPWELREFVYDDDGFLTMDTLKLTPDISFNGGALVGDLMVDPADQDDSLFESMLAGAIDVPFPPAAEFWTTSASVDPNWRHEFSLNTCNACHGGETGTFFTHVKETVPGVATTLSSFLVGNPGFVAPDPTFNDFFEFTDPVDGVTDRYFFDIERRRQDLQDLVDSSCSNLLLEVPVMFKH